MDFDSLDIRIDLDKISDFDSLEIQDTEVLMLHRQILQSFFTSDPVTSLDFIMRITLESVQMNMRW